MLVPRDVDVEIRGGERGGRGGGLIVRRGCVDNDERAGCVDSVACHT